MTRFAPLALCAALVTLVGCSKPPDTAKELQMMKDQAQSGCVKINNAAKAYAINPENPGQTDLEKWPAKPDDLVVVPFGGRSFLEGGKADLVDPWGKAYRLEPRVDAAGNPFMFVSTTAPDGTPISQYGIGPNAEPRN